MRAWFADLLELIRLYFGFGPNDDDIADRHNGGPLPSSNGDWIVMPYRLAEACRISLHSVGNHPDLPPHIANWIAEWLNGYNVVLSAYFSENYGEDVFPILNAITLGVRERGEEQAAERTETQLTEFFDRWEEQLTDQDRPDDA